MGVARRPRPLNAEAEAAGAGKERNAQERAVLCESPATQGRGLLPAQGRG